MLPNYLLRKITPAAAKLYMVLFNSMDPASEDPIIRVPVTTLARRSTFSPRSVWTTLAELEELHLIRRLPRHYHRANTYQLLPVPATPPAASKTPTTPPNEKDILPLAQPAAHVEPQPAQPTAHDTPTTQTTSPLAQPAAHVEPQPAQPASHDAPIIQNTPPLAQPAAHVPPTPSTPHAPDPQPHTHPPSMGNPHCPFSIVLNICSGNALALPPELRKMPPSQLESLFFQLFSQLTPDQQAQALAAAQASLPRQSPQTLPKARSETP